MCKFSLLIGKFYSGPLGNLLRSERFEFNTLNGGGNGCPDQAVEPVVVGPRGSNFPFVDRSSVGERFDSILPRQMFRKQLMNLRIVTEQRNTAGIAHHHGKTGVNERFPIVRVDQNVPHLSLPRNVRNAPV